MTDKKKAARQGSPSQNNTRRNSTSTASQEHRLLAFWQATGEGINRYEAERLLTICHLAARVKGLEEKGCVIAPRIEEIATDPYGHQHKGIMRYWLKSAPLHLLQAANDADYDNDADNGEGQP